MTDKTVSIGSFPITPVDPSDDRLRAKLTTEDIDAWMRRLYAVAHIPTVKFRNGTVGLVNTPGKYVAVIDAMHAAIVAAATGEPLPDLVEPAPKKKARKS